MKQADKQSILWVTWKDHKHPEAGGAEVVAREITTRLAAEGNRVTVLTCGYEGAADDEMIDGIRFLRVGRSRYLHPFQASAYYRKHLKGKYDVVIEEVQGSAPYFVTFSRSDRTKYFYLYHQLGRLNWLYEVPKPFSYVGYYLLAPVATRIASVSGAPTITVSDSTKKVLSRYGFSQDKTHIISEGLHFEPLQSLDGVSKYGQPTVLSFGAMRAMKRTLDQVKAFEMAKQSIPDLRMKIAGSNKGKYGHQVMEYIAHSKYSDDIEYLGKVDTETKAELMQKCHAILVTSVEEGWGLIVSEANGQGTPAVVYDVSGLRDSVRDGETGVVVEPRPRAVAKSLASLLYDDKLYERLRRSAWSWSKELTFEKAFSDFTTIIRKDEVRA